MKIEVYRSCIPANKLMNENSGQHYRTQQGKQRFIANQFDDLLNEREEAIGGFKMPLKSEIFALTKKRPFTVIMETWRPQNYGFDPINYSRTYKTPLDLLITNGYAVDDNWKFIKGYYITGGGYDAWTDRAFRYDGDGLPDQIDLDWWFENCSSEKTDMLIRIIFEFDGE